jgi:hypothetical protein
VKSGTQILGELSLTPARHREERFTREESDEVSVGALAGCGADGYFSHATKSYTVTVSAVCGAYSHSASVNLTVR